MSTILYMLQKWWFHKVPSSQVNDSKPSVPSVDSDLIDAASPKKKRIREHQLDTDPNNQYNTGQKKPNQEECCCVFTTNKMGLNYDDCVNDILYHTDRRITEVPYFHVHISFLHNIY